MYEALVAAYPDGGPDLVEFPDYLAEGFVTCRPSGPATGGSATRWSCVRTHTTAEIVHVLNGHRGDGRETRAIYDDGALLPAPR